MNVAPFIKFEVHESTALSKCPAIKYCRANCLPIMEGLEGNGGSFTFFPQSNFQVCPLVDEKPAGIPIDHRAAPDEAPAPAATAPKKLAKQPSSRIAVNMITNSFKKSAIHQAQQLRYSCVGFFMLIISERSRNKGSFSPCSDNNHTKFTNQIFICTYILRW